MSPAEKKTAAINFRVPQSFRDKVNALAEETGWSVSDISSFGLLAYWPEIETLVRASGTQLSSSTSALREFIELCQVAQARGVDPKKALIDALEVQTEMHAQAVA